MLLPHVRGRDDLDPRARGIRDQGLADDDGRLDLGRVDRLHHGKDLALGDIAGGLAGDALLHPALHLHGGGHDDVPRGAWRRAGERLYQLYRHPRLGRGQQKL